MIANLVLGFSDFCPFQWNSVIRRQERATLDTKRAVVNDWSARTPDCRFILRGGTIRSVWLLSLRRRQRGPTRNLGTKRVAFVALE